jgi:hypothetical protein
MPQRFQQSSVVNGLAASSLLVLARSICTCYYCCPVSAAHRYPLDPFRNGVTALDLVFHSSI